MSWTSSEHLMYVQFTSCVCGEIKVISYITKDDARCHPHFSSSMLSNYELIKNYKYNFLSAGFGLHYTSEKKLQWEEPLFVCENETTPLMNIKIWKYLTNFCSYSAFVFFPNPKTQKSLAKLLTWYR